MTEQALYRFFGDDGALLYVGISLHPFARMSQHKADKSWWGEVATVAIQRFPTREAVEVAERLAIQAEAPRYNVVHTVRPKPPKKPQGIPFFHGWHPLAFQDACPWCQRHAFPSRVDDQDDSFNATYECLKSCGSTWTHAFRKSDLERRAERAPHLRPSFASAVA